MNAFRVDVMQAWKDDARRVLNKVGGVFEEGWSAGSTEYSFLLESRLSADKIQDRLFSIGMNWARVRDWKE